MSTRNASWLIYSPTFFIILFKGEQKALFLRHEGYLGAIGAFIKGAEEEVNYNWRENYAGSSGLLTRSFKTPQLQEDVKVLEVMKYICMHYIVSHCVALHCVALRCFAKTNLCICKHSPGTA